MQFSVYVHTIIEQMDKIDKYDVENHLKEQTKRLFGSPFVGALQHYPYGSFKDLLEL